MSVSDRIPKKLYWMWLRLRCMSAQEIVHRVNTIVFNQIQKIGYFTANNPPAPSIQSESAFWFGRTKEIDASAYCRTSDRIIQGYLNIFDLHDFEFGHPPQWNRDPLTGKNAPAVFGKTLDYRDENLVGDIKYLWEPSRHLQLVALAQAYHLTGSEKYLDGIRVQLESWLDQCPYLIGPQWVSSLEVAIRLINWYLVWQLIGGLGSDIFKGKEGEAFLARWLDSIYQHAHFINDHYSLHSSANNHRIGEASGLFIATIGWPFWPEFKRWQQSSKDILEREVLLQNTTDGVNREQAIAYQQFVLDFLLLSYLSAKANNIALPREFVATIEKMLEFVASIMDVAGRVPMIGDADDGFVVCLTRQNDWNPYQSLLVTGSVLFRRLDFCSRADQYDEKTRWLLGDNAYSVFQSLKDENTESSIKTAFEEGGYYILGNNFGNADEVKIVADAGPLGYLSIAAHGHADALSITLSAGGNEIFVDPGTYTYHTKKYWRDYFRGTAAHNTLRVDRLDQSVIGGNFLWLRKAKISNVDWYTDEDTDALSASHDGYERLADPVRHERKILYNKSEKTIRIIDSLDCRKEHLVEIFWHLSERCQVEQGSDCVEILCGQVKVSIGLLNSSGCPDIVKGREDPPLGWISRCFGKKEPTTTLVWQRTICGPCELKSEIAIEFLGNI